MGGVDAAEGGAERLNALAVARLRDAFVVVSARELVASRLSGDETGSLEGADALEAGRRVANLLGFELGRWEEARELYVAVADGCGVSHGADAEKTLRARSDLAVAVQMTGAVAEARAAYEELLPRMLAAEGEGSDGMLVLRQNLAGLLGESGDWAAARPLYEAAVAGRTSKHGAEDARTLSVRMNFAMALEMLGDVASARLEYNAVLAGQTAALGPRDPTTLNTQFNLARLLYQEHREREEGWAMMREVAAGFTTVLGLAHEWTKGAVQKVEQWEQEMAGVVAATPTASVSRSGKHA